MKFIIHDNNRPLKTILNISSLSVQPVWLNIYKMAIKYVLLIRYIFSLPFPASMACKLGQRGYRDDLEIRFFIEPMVKGYNILGKL